MKELCLFLKKRDDVLGCEYADKKVHFGLKASIDEMANFKSKVKIQDIDYDDHLLSAEEKARKKEQLAARREYKENYDIAIKDLVHRPGISPLELVTPVTIKKIRYFISTIKREVEKEFHNPKLRQILQFPVLFLGAKPSQTPAFYNFMNHNSLWDESFYLTPLGTRFVERYENNIKSIDQV